LDSIVRDYQFFFMGEEHRKAINAPLQLAFMLYLHQQADVRNLIVEGGFSTGFLLNQYLRTGDEGLLTKVLTNIPVCPDDQLDLFRQIYQYNQALPDSARIRVTGIDLDHSPELSLQVLHTLLSDASQAISPDIAPIIARIPALHLSSYYYPREVKRFFKRLHQSLRRHPEAHQALWGPYYERVSLLTANTLAGYRFGLVKAMIFERVWRRREEQMYANFLALQPYLAPGGYFAQFGLLHTDLGPSPRWDFATLAHRLNRTQGSPVAARVLTISRYIRQLEDRYQTLGEGIAFLRMARYAEQRYPNQVVLARLTGPETPFARLSESFQYILLIDAQREADGCQ
jgi:hypothetical protein